MNATGVFILFLIAIGMQIYLKPRKKKKQYKKNSNNTTYTQKNYWRNENKMKEKNTKTITIKTIGEHFHKSSREINKIFEELKWIEKKDRWWILTPAGETKGGKELYNPKNKTKYTIWNENILHDYELINKINKSKENNQNQANDYNNFYATNKKRKMTPKEKKEKGDKYEKYIANFFREQGYYVWEHGKEKGMEDMSIDLIIKKEKFIYFVQCKHWENQKINHFQVKAIRPDVQDYLKKINKQLWQLIKDYESKILLITSKNCLTKGAYTYIKENQELIEYQVIPMQ